MGIFDFLKSKSTPASNGSNGLNTGKTFDVAKVREYLKTEPNEGMLWNSRTVVPASQVPQSDLERFVKDGTFLDKQTGNYLYGGEQQAMQYAKDHGLKTLEMKLNENPKVFQNAGFPFKDGKPFYDGNDPNNKQAWDIASKTFAEEASGKITVFQGGEPPRKGSVYERVEYPALKQNEKITSLEKCDPYWQHPTTDPAFNLEHQDALQKKGRMKLPIMIF